MLSANPKAGDLIPAGHGFRKVRWHLSNANRGKRSGIRVIYYWAGTHRIFMVYAYAKNKEKDLPRDWLNKLSVILKEAP